MQTWIRTFTLWDNPVFHRFRHSQLRFKSSLFWLLATLIVATFIVSLNYIIQTNIGMSEQQAARNQWIPLLVIQGLILLLKGTGKTSAGLIQDKIEQTLDYQRLTPVAPLRNVVGYLFGLPLLEYAMFALTLPHLAFVVIKGAIPFGDVLTVYVAFFTCTLFYHTTALAMAMVMKRWIWGYLLSMFSVVFLNTILPLVGTQLGLKFLQYLSVLPVIGQKVLPLRQTILQFRLEQNGGQLPNGIPPLPAFQRGPVDPEVTQFADTVPFFDWSLSPFVFTLLLQSGLIITFTTMAIRRWQKESKHSLGKFYAFGVLAAFILLFTGNLWPVVTGEYLPFRIFGIGSLALIRNEIAVALPLIYAVAIWLICVFLFSNIVPNHQAYVRGVRRAHKLGRKAAKPWDDDSASLWFMGLLIVLALAGYWFIESHMIAAGYTDVFLQSDLYAHWRLPLALGLMLVCTLLLLQTLEYRGATIASLLIWVLPVLIAIVSGAAMERVSTFHTVLASVSPLATTMMAGMLPLDAFLQDDPNAQFDTFQTGVHAGLVFAALQIALLSARWYQLRRKLR